MAASTESEEGAGRQAAAQLAQYLELPMVSRAWICKHDGGSDGDFYGGGSDADDDGPRRSALLTVLLTQRDLAGNQARRFTVSAHLPRVPSKRGRLTAGPPAELRDAQLLSHCHTGAPARGPGRAARPRAPPGACPAHAARAAPEGAGTLLQVWTHRGVLCELAVPKSVHGAVYGDGWFAGCAWCPRGDRVAYVAEARARAPPPCRPAPAPRAVRARHGDGRNARRSPPAARCRSGAAGARTPLARMPGSAMPTASRAPRPGPGARSATGRRALARARPRA